MSASNPGLAPRPSSGAARSRPAAGAAGPGVRSCWLGMRCASPAVLVAFCAGLWVSNPAPALGREAGGRPGADCEGERRETCLHGGGTALHQPLLALASLGRGYKSYFTQKTRALPRSLAPAPVPGQKVGPGPRLMTGCVV